MARHNRHYSTQPTLPPSLNARKRIVWFGANARQQNFDRITSSLNLPQAYDEDGFLNIDLSSPSVQTLELAPCFYTADPELLSRLRFLGMVEGYGVVLPEDEAQRPLVENRRTVHDPEIERTCSLAVFKLRCLFFGNTPLKERYHAIEFIPLETIQAHPEYEKTKKELDTLFSDKKHLSQRLLNRLQARIKKNNFNDNVYFQLAARFLHLNVDALSKDSFEFRVLKDNETLKAFVEFIVNALSQFYHERLGKDLKGHLEPRENGNIGIVLKDKSIEGEVQNFCGTPEENLILAWKMLYAEDERAPEEIKTEKTKSEQEKVREDLVSDYLFHLVGVYFESPAHGAACGQGTWIRTLDFFNGKYNEKILRISSEALDLSQITKEGIAKNYSNYIAKALQDERFQSCLGTLYYWNKHLPTALQQAFIGAIKKAFAVLYRQHFNELPAGYTLTIQDWVRLDRLLYEPRFTETLQSEIRKIANPFLVKNKTSILDKIQKNKKAYQPAFQELAWLIKDQDLSVLQQISGEVSAILQHLKNKQPRNERMEKCELLLKTLNTPLASFVLSPQLHEQLKRLLTRAQSVQKKGKAFQAFLIEMDKVDDQLATHYQNESQQSLTVNYRKPKPHPLFKVMGEQHACVFWKDFIRVQEILEALLKQFPHVPLKGIDNPYTEERLNCYTFESQSSQPKLDLTLKGLLPEPGRSILEKNKWSDRTLLEEAVGGEHPEWLKTLLKRHQYEIKQNPRLGLTEPLELACDIGNVEITSCLLDLIKQEGMDINQVMSFNSFHYACNNRLEVVRLLLQHENFNVMIEDEEGNTPLHSACIFGYPEIVRLLLETEKININHKNKKGYTALDVAYLGDHNTLNPKVIQLLLENHAKINKAIKIDGDNTLLQWACWSAHLEIVKRLLASDDIDEDYVQHANTQGRTAFDYAREHLQNNPEILSLLLANKKFKIPESTNVGELLSDACKYGHIELVKQLLTYPEADVNYCDPQYEKSILDIAGEHGKVEVIKVLLEEPDIQFKLFDPTYNVHVRDKMWGNLKTIYESLQASDIAVMYEPHQREMQRAFSCSDEAVSLFSSPSPLKGRSPLLPWWAIPPLLSVLLCSTAFGVLALNAPYRLAEYIALVSLLPWFLFAATPVNKPLLLPYYLICTIACVFKGKSLESSLDLGFLMLPPGRIEKIKLPEGKTFSDYQAWRRAVKRKLPKGIPVEPDYERADDLHFRTKDEIHYRKKSDYVKKLKKKEDPFDYKELHEEEDGQYVYLPSHKAGMLYLYTEQPNADEVQSDVFCAAKGNSPEFVKKLLK